MATPLEIAQARIKELQATIDNILGYDRPHLFDGWTEEDKEEYAQTSPTEMFDEIRQYKKLFYPQWENAPAWATHSLIEVMVYWTDYDPTAWPPDGSRSQRDHVASMAYNKDEFV